MTNQNDTDPVMQSLISNMKRACTAALPPSPRAEIASALSEAAIQSPCRTSRSRLRLRVFLSLRRGPRGDYEPLTANGVYQVIKDAVARTPISKHVHPHLFRHSWMTEMLRNGMSPIQLSIIAGASVQVISEHYAHLTKGDDYDAMMRALTADRT